MGGGGRVYPQADNMWAVFINNSDMRNDSFDAT